MSESCPDCIEGGTTTPACADGSCTETTPSTDKVTMYAPLIIGGISLLQTLIVQISKWRESALKTKENTPEQDAAYEVKLQEMFKSAHWIPRP